MNFTIKELCDYLEAEVPAELIERQEQEVTGINARYTTLEKGDAFFDINNDCEDLTLINPRMCPFIISDREIEDGSLSIPVVKINNALDRYVGLCKAFVDEYPDTVRIAVTGSNGKTSMKETISSILENIAATDKTFSNQNNIYYLSKRLQKIMPNDLRFYVQEASAKTYEDINLTQKLAVAYQPKIVVMTNICDNHAELFGDREETFKIKSSLVEEMKDDGVALLNMDDDILRNYHPCCRTIYYSLDNPEADIYASNIKISNEGTGFDIHWNGRVIKDVFCPMIGRHNIYNCMAAFVIGSLNGGDDEILVKAIMKINNRYSLRQNHIKIGPYNLFIDCFNASLESIENDMETMADLSPDEGGRKIVVVGDVTELGEKVEDIHKRIGSTIVRYKIDKFFCFGEYSGRMYEGAMEENPGASFSAFTDRAEMEKSIMDYIRPGDLILWKASRHTHLEITIDNLFGTDYYSLYPEDILAENAVHIYPQEIEQRESFIQRRYTIGKPVGGLLGKSLQGGEFEYCQYENGIKYVRYGSREINAVIPAQINGFPIRSIGDRAFYKSGITSVSISDSVVNLSTNVFLRCCNLRNVKMSDNIKLIDISAFAICTALEEICIPESCLLIRRKAFYQCTRLKTVVIEGMNTYLEERVFQECPKVRLVCRKGSAAEKYAIEQAITYCLLEEDGSRSEWITPNEVEKEIVIYGTYWEEYDGKSRLNIELSFDDERHETIWYEVDSKWKQYMCDDRVDAVVVSLLLFAIRGRFARIRSDLPISEQLKYQLTYHLIPQIVDFEGEENATAVELDMPATNVVYKKSFIANGTGFSRGVDSFATLYEYGKNSAAPEDYKINFLNVYNVGAFHGRDTGKRSRHSSKEMFTEQAESTALFAEEYGYNALVVDSNLDMLIRSRFKTEPYGKLGRFQNSASERNIGTTLLFQKLFSRFYYASGHTMKEFKLSLDESSALWEQYAVQFFSTENLRFYIANRDWTRMEKVERVAQLPEAYDNLQVCLVQSHNCGTCMKCKRTLMNLDVLGEDVLDRFAKSFDLETYKRDNREEFFTSMWEDKDSDEYVRDILRAAINSDSPLIQNPPIHGSEYEYTYRYTESRISVMSYPTFLSKEICLLTNSVSDEDLFIEGMFKRSWVKLHLSDGRTGYIAAKKIRIARVQPATEMHLNGGTRLLLVIGKKYGFRPIFTPTEGNEQVTYSVDNAHVAYVNKMGWVYAVSEGETTLTAVSRSGLEAKCLIVVRAPRVKKEGKLKRFVKRILPPRLKSWIKKHILHSDKS